MQDSDVVQLPRKIGFWSGEDRNLDERCSLCPHKMKIAHREIDSFQTLVDRIVAQSTPDILPPELMKTKKGKGIVYPQKERILQYLRAQGISIPPQQRAPTFAVKTKAHILSEVRVSVLAPPHLLCQK